MDQQTWLTASGAKIVFEETSPSSKLTARLLFPGTHVAYMLCIACTVCVCFSETEY